ncbi:MAG: sulfoxide reductase heme-binding subunit YedZ [Calditrichae bacterium]|nr:sulfoxide reductase heme-binding subunit YedZ [Calditrichota bacterium]MCB9057930.1 sulfoxide reductase heme-binding subunit YedZ [Calditrichia bacterium]
MRLIKIFIFFLSLFPTFYLVYGTFTDNLGANPIEKILHETGFWALIFLMITLSVTPLRKIKGLNKIINLRRMLGLFAFFYVVLHFLVYLGLDRLLDWDEIVKDITKRPYITVGFSAFLMLIPLAVTSTKGWMKKLGKRWQKLHRLIYVAGVLGVIHFWWLVKKDITDPLIFAIILTGLLGIRIYFALVKKKHLKV